MTRHSFPASNLAARLEALHDASFGWAVHCCDGDGDNAADVLQASYVKVLGGRAVFEERSSFRTWLFGVIRFTALEMRRRGARELALAARIEPGEPPPSAEAAMVAAEEQAQLQHALAQLPERQREVLHLVFYHELSVSEAAEVMEVSVGSARVHYDRGKKRLRTLLSTDGTIPGTRAADPLGYGPSTPDHEVGDARS
jgi:RNA polymerase sigma factor (sigma-70 family)